VLQLALQLRLQLRLQLEMVEGLQQLLT